MSTEIAWSGDFLIRRRAARSAWCADHLHENVTFHGCAQRGV